MCGIAGIVNLGGEPLPPDGLAQEMASRLFHRGPDGEGRHEGPGVSIAFRRLAVIDPSAPSGPYADETGQIIAAVNGEIYNYPELSADLRKRGHRLLTHCDTEIVAHLYEEYGPELAGKLDGMFALAVWDARSKRLLLARDRAGEKPLYYAVCGRKLLFASELQALLASDEVSRELDGSALALYLLHDHYPSPTTPLRHVRKLPAAHRLVADASGVRVERYWSLAPAWEASPWDERPEALADRLLEILGDSVRRRWRSDVPAGVFLSGGLDSSTIVALLAKMAPGRIRTFTLGFEDPRFDESSHASRTAADLHLEHTEGRAGFDQLETALQNVAPRMADPLADPSLLPAWLISRLARQQVTVVLSGEGSDEIFGGYPTYTGHKLADALRTLPAPARRLLGSLLLRLPVTQGNHSVNLLARQLAAGMDLDTLPRHLRWFGSVAPALQERIVTEEFRRRCGAWDPMRAARDAVGGIAFRDDLCRVMHLDLSTYLQDGLLTKMDRASMLHSLEVRTPFLDHHLIEFAARLPSRLKVRGPRTKVLLRQAAGRLLPRETLRRRKRGFSIPLAHWIHSDRGRILADELNPDRLKRQGIFAPSTVQALLSEQLQGRADNRRILWNLLMFQLWHRHYIEEPVDAARPVRRSAALSIG